MSEYENRPSVSSSVMEQINSGSINMKPRLYYSLLAAISAGVVVLAGIVMAYFWSIILLWIRIETSSTPARGARANLAESLDSFPLWAVAGAILLLILAVVLVRRQGRMYRLRATSIALIILISTLLLGATLSVFDVGRSHTPNRFEQSNGQRDGKQQMRNNNLKETQ